jgi:endonuclease-3
VKRKAAGASARAPSGKAAKPKAGWRRESRAGLERRSAEILKRLKAEYPNAHCELDYRTPYELLVATILSAQCTDARVNLVTPEFFRRWPTPRALAGADEAEVQDVIRSTGFFRNKTRSLLGMAAGLMEQHDGQVPADMAKLRALPGVGRKTANVVLGNAFAINEGVTVDTHVQRLSARLRLSTRLGPEKVEQDLMALIPRDDWTLISHLLIWHGRRICIARKPKCPDCVVNDLCPSARL